jgi:hypothetical protein
MKKTTRKSINTIINKTEKYLAKIKEMNENKEDPEKIRRVIFNITSVIFSELITPQSTAYKEEFISEIEDEIDYQEYY